MRFFSNLLLRSDLAVWVGGPWTPELNQAPSPPPEFNNPDEQSHVPSFLSEMHTQRHHLTTHTFLNLKQVSRGNSLLHAVYMCVFTHTQEHMERPKTDRLPQALLSAELTELVHR